MFDLATAECSMFLAQRALEDILERGSDIGRASALNLYHKHLTQAVAVSKDILDKADQRLSRHAVTLQDHAQIREHSAALEKQLAQTHTDLMAVNVRGHEPEGPLETYVNNYVKAAAVYEKKSSHLRRLDAVQIDMRNGITPTPNPQWFGAVTLNINLGVFSRNAAEERYLKHRETERYSAAYEVVERLRITRSLLHETQRSSLNELRLLREQRDLLNKQRNHLEASNSVASTQALDIIRLRLLLIDANIVYLENLISRRETLLSATSTIGSTP